MTLYIIFIRNMTLSDTTNYNQISGKNINHLYICVH